MVFEGRAPYLWWETDRRVSTPSMLRVDYDRWGQTPEDLRQLATSAAHQRTRERFLALYEVTLNRVHFGRRGSLPPWPSHCRGSQPPCGLNRGASQSGSCTVTTASG